MTAGESDASRKVVVDASVAAKWLLRDEELTDEADHLVDAVDVGDVALCAPAQIIVEVAASLRKAVLTRRVSRAAVESLLDHWLQVYGPKLALTPNTNLLPLALPRALDLGVTLFDALYVILAEELGAQLVTADVRLLASPAGDLPLVAHLGADGTEQAF